MKLCKNITTDKIHAVYPSISLYQSLSFCGSAGLYVRDYIYYEGSEDEITCKKCRKPMQNYIVRKLKNEI